MTPLPSSATPTGQPSALFNPPLPRAPSAPAPATAAALPSPQLVVVGSAAVDLTTRPAKPHVLTGAQTTVPGSVELTPGGVGLNVALCAHRLLASTSLSLAAASEGQAGVVLVAPRADDAFGRVLSAEVDRLGLRSDGLVVVSAVETGARTAVCSLVLDGEGGLDGGVADMGIVEALDADLILARLTTLRPSLVAVDGNLSPATLARILAHCTASRTPTLFEPTSVPKSTRILAHLATKPGNVVDAVTPNLFELRELYAAVDAKGLMERPEWWAAVEELGLGEEWRGGVERWARRGPGEWVVKDGVVQMLTALAPFFPTQLVKLGPLGCVSLRLLPSALARSTDPLTLTSGRLALAFHPPGALEPGKEVNTTGAGDSLVGAVLAGLVQTASKEGGGGPLGGSVDQWARVVERGQRAARASLAAPTAVGDVGGPGWEL